MQSNISIRQRLIADLDEKEARDSFIATHLSTAIASQIHSMREKREWTQAELADKSGMKQARISVLENPNYDQFSIKTLRRLASAFDVALVVKFAPFSEVVDWVANIADEHLAVCGYAEDEALHNERSAVVVTNPFHEGMPNPGPPTDLSDVVFAGTAPVGPKGGSVPAVRSPRYRLGQEETAPQVMG